MHVIVFCVFYMVLYNSENDTRERNKRREDSSLLFSPLACFLPSRVFSARVFYHNAGVPPTVNLFEFKLQPHCMFSRLSFQ